MQGKSLADSKRKLIDNDLVPKEKSRQTFTTFIILILQPGLPSPWKGLLF